MSGSADTDYDAQGLPSAELVARIVGNARGYVPAADVVAAFGGSIDLAGVAALPAVKLGVGGEVLVPRLVFRLAESFGLPGVAPILAARLVWGLPREDGTAAPLPTAEQIKRAMGNARSELKHREFAKRAGAPVAVVRAMFERGGLPGARRISAGVVMVPRRLLLLAQSYGLPQVERMANAGLL